MLDGFNYLLLIVDHYTKYGWVALLKDRAEKYVRCIQKKKHYNP